MQNNKKGKKTELTKEQIDEIQETFTLFDNDKIGVIDVYELRQAVKTLGFDISKEEAVNLVEQVENNDGSRTIDFPNFLTLMKKKMLEFKDGEGEMCEEYKKDKQTELTKEQIDQFQQIFTLFDIDKCGCIDVYQLRQAMKTLGFDVSKEEAKKLIDQVDNTGSGNIEFSQFLTMMKQKMLDVEDGEGEICEEYKKEKKTELTKQQIDEISGIFTLFDIDKCGCIDLYELRQAMKTLGFDVSKEEAQKLVDQVDKYGSGTIEFPEFLTMMKKKILDVEDGEGEMCEE